MFVKYGMITDEKFYDKAEKFCLVTDEEGKKYTIEEFKSSIAETQKDKDDNLIVLYTNDKDGQHSYLKSAKNKGYKVIVLDGPLDSHFVNHLEQKQEKTQFKRIDADSVDKLIEKDQQAESVLTKEESETLQKIYEKAIANESYSVSVDAAHAEDLPVSITLPEFMRRMKEMSMASGMGMGMGNMPDSFVVSINGNHEVNSKILKTEGEAKQVEMAKYNFELGLLSKGLLKGQALTDFVERSVSKNI
jgi:molecular chaperone HtpG